MPVCLGVLECRRAGAQVCWWTGLGPPLVELRPNPADIGKIWRDTNHVARAEIDQILPESANKMGGCRPNLRQRRQIWGQIRTKSDKVGRNQQIGPKSAEVDQSWLRIGQV